MTWKELLAWIDEHVTTEREIQSIGKGNGISTEPLAPSYKATLRYTKNGIAYYAANGRNAKTIELIWNKLQGAAGVPSTPVQKKTPSEQPITQEWSVAQPTKQISPFSGLRNSNQQFFCNHKRECYRGQPRECMDAMALFENRLYYVAREDHSDGYKLYTSLEDGTDIRLLRELGDRDCGVSVNSEGIFLFPSLRYGRYKDELKKSQYGVVTWIDWDGTTRNEMNILQGCLATWTDFVKIDAYVYGQRVYYILEENAELYGERQERYSAYYVDLMYNTRTTIIKGRKGGRELSKLCGTYEKAMFCSSYKEDRYYSSEDVWYYMDLFDKQMISLDEQHCHWDNHVRKEYGKALNIMYLNLEKDVMWVLEDNTLIPLRIGTDRNAVLPGMQKMDLKENSSYLEDSYFDGERLFVAPYYWQLYSKYGNNDWIDWTQDTHGQCEKMIILGNYLYVDINARGSCNGNYNGYVDGQFEACTYKIGRCVQENMWFRRWYY